MGGVPGSTSATARRCDKSSHEANDYTGNTGVGSESVGHTPKRQWPVDVNADGNNGKFCSTSLGSFFLWKRFRSARGETYNVELMKRLLLLLPVFALAGCGNYLNVESQGISGVSYDSNRGIAVHMYICDDNSVNRLELVGGFYDGPSGTNNPPLGALEPPEPESGYVVVDLADPSPWEVVEPLALPTEKEKYIIASPRVVDGGLPLPFAKEKYLSSVALTVGEIEALEPDLVVRDSFQAPNHVYGTSKDFAEDGAQWCAENF